MRKKVLSLFLVFTLCLTLLPTAAFAEGGEENIISDASVEEVDGVLVPPGGTAEDDSTDIAEFAAGEDAASVTKSDGTDRGTFTSLAEALNKAKDGDTVTLLGKPCNRLGRRRRG